MSGKEAQEAATTPTAGKKVESESAEKPSETQHAEERQHQEHQHIDGYANRDETGPPTSAEDDAAAVDVHGDPGNEHDNDNGTGSGDNSGRPKLPRPTGIQPCPRCGSMETKFCYYNNYNIKQPRYYCKGCQRYWTAGGTLRDVPVGAGRRRTKGTRSQDETLSGGGNGGFSAGSLPPYVDPALAAITMAAAAVSKSSALICPVIPRVLPPVIPPVLPGMLPPGIIPTLPFPTPVDFSHLAAAAAAASAAVRPDSLTKATANALVADPIATAFGFMHPQQHHPGAVAAKTNVTVNQKSKDNEVSEDGAIEGRRTKRKTVGDGTADGDAQGEEQANGRSANNNKNNGSGGNGGAGSGPLSAGAMLPMHHVPPYSMDWFAAQQNPQAAIAMQAQFQAAAAAGYGVHPPYAMPGMSAMWPGYGYGAFPPAGWSNPAAYSVHETSAGRAGSAGAGGGGDSVKPEQAVHMAGMPWPVAQWPSMVMHPYAMASGVAMPGAGLIPPQVPTPATAGAVGAAAALAAAPAAPSVNATTNHNINNNKTNGPSEDAD